ncbi:hypothetical protein SOVF_171900 [Spinacia oleracea]|nr:hypothetical protein SOVF_171900 [Spinacia oleracea]
MIVNFLVQVLMTGIAFGDVWGTRCSFSTGSHGGIGLPPERI